MSTHADKTQENKSQSIAEELSNKQNSVVKSSPAFADNRPQAVAQLKQQAMVNNSPRLKQMKAFQEMADNSHASVLQRKEKEEEDRQQREGIQTQANNTGLPDNLKSGIENLSGYSMDDVKVHYNSGKPAQLRAHAYAQGSDIHIAQGQEQHLAHEAWHVVQQKQGRVKPTLQMKGGPVNDDSQLEKEADLMGLRALNNTSFYTGALQHRPAFQGSQTAQRFSDDINDARRDKAEKASGKDMQLDHAISQDTMKNFFRVITKVGAVEKTISPPAYAAYVKIRDKVFGAQEITKVGVGALLNLRNNITAGYTETIGNPGHRFDPQVVVDGDMVKETVQSAHLETMDRMMRSIIRKEEIINRINTLDPETIGEFMNELNMEIGAIADSMAHLGGEGNVPEFDKKQWHEHKGKMVKKVAAQYLGEEDPMLARLGTRMGFNNKPMFIMERLLMQKHDIKKGKKGKKDVLSKSSFPVIVVVKVPPEAWNHIYQRHTIENFAWDIQGTNTFWKNDPRAEFENRQSQVIAELLLTIERQEELETKFAKMEDPENGEDPEGEINAAGTTFFFQGNYIFNETDDADESDREICITLKSFAPQHPEIAYAIEPAILQRRKPVVAAPAAPLPVVGGGAAAEVGADAEHKGDGR
ncbi:MAG: hypothetical protein K0S33_2476 [Bacteroidetes bacterium]|jgi:hypothetical protein|nr:hypothetical protein [Bacteroidota bacterium]